MTLVHLLQLYQLQLFWEAFPQGLGVCLCECLTILSEAHLWGHTLMLDGEAWLSVSALNHPKGVLTGWGRNYVQASQVHPHQTLSSMSLWTLLFCWCTVSNISWYAEGFRISFTGTKGRNTLAQPLAIWSVWGDSDKLVNKSVWCGQLRWKLLEPCGRCLLRFNMRSLRWLAVGGWTPSDTLIGCLFNDHSDWRCDSESALCMRGGTNTFSLLQRLHITMSPRPDNVTISSAIMIFQVMPSIVFHKHLLRSNEYWANTVCTLFSSDILWSALRSVISCFHVLEYRHGTSATRC